MLRICQVARKANTRPIFAKSKSRAKLVLAMSNIAKISEV